MSDWVVQSLMASWLFFVLLEQPLLASNTLAVGPSHVVAVLVIVVALYVVLRDGLTLNQTAKDLVRFVWVFVILLFIWSFISADQTTSIIRSTTVLYYLCIVLSLLVLFQQQRSRSIKLSLWGALLGAVGSILLGLYYGPGLEAERFSSTAEYNPTWFGAGMIAGGFCALGIAGMLTARWKRTLLWVIAVVFLCGVFLSQSRNALLAATVSFAIVGMIFLWRSVLRKNVGRFIRILVVGACGVSAGIGSWYMIESAQLAQLTRVEALWSGDLAQASAGRNHIWADAIQIAGEGEVLLGIGNAKQARSRDWQMAASPHNQYITLLIETAGTMLVLFVGFQLWLIWKCIQTRKHWVTLWLAVFLPVFAVGNDVLYYKYYWILLVVLSALWGLERLGRQMASVKR